MTDHDTAAAILADMTGLPIDNPFIQSDAARLAPRIATTDLDTLRAEITAEHIDMAAALVALITTIKAQERVA